MPFLGNRIAKTTSDFGDLIRSGGCFVDKSGLIGDLLRSADNAILTVRPGRFGKSTICSMLEYFFSHEVNGISTAGLFDRLEITHLEDGRYMGEQGQYPVIALSLKDVRGDSFREFITNFKMIIQELYRSHEVYLRSSKLSEATQIGYRKFLLGEMDEANLTNAL